MVGKKIVILSIMSVFVFFFTSTLFASDTKEDKVSGTQTKVEEKIPEAEIEQKTPAAEEKAPESNSKSVKTININKATAIELSSVLKKVGPKYAAAIVKYREENGEFKAPEDIKNVKGIGAKIFELNKDIIVVKD